MKKLPFLFLLFVAGAFACASFPSAIAQAAQVAPQQMKTANSHNWAGYVSTLGDFTSIEGSWIVPSVASTSTGADAAWIGIGGMSGSDLIQIGVRSYTVNGSVSYQPWYELLPTTSTPIALTIHAGDQMEASITETSLDHWQIGLTDVTSGKTFTTTLSYHSSESSAEWIEEAPQKSGQLYALDAFSPVVFSNLSASRNRVSAAFAALDLTKLTLVDAANQILATASALEAGSFAVNRA